VINGAIVTARGYLPAYATTASMWIEDASGPIFLYNVDLGMDPTQIQPGDEVQFQAVTGTEYFGTPEITAIGNFSVVSTGNPVHVVDGMTGAPVTVADHLLYNVEIYGELTAGPEDCGANCFDLTYGSNTVTLRTQSDFLVLGDCIHWIGPVGTFDSEVQLDADDFDWYRYY
jgi:hypothetical protein